MKIIVGNQKNYMSKDETIDFFKRIRKCEWKKDVIICPSLVFIPLCNHSDLNIGSQYVTDHCPFSSGTSVEQLKDLNVKYCIVGHSDNRNYQNETDIISINKSKLLLNSDITPIYCFSETEKILSDSILHDWVSDFVLLLKSNINKDDIEKIIFAYEPFYNINNSKTSNASLDISQIKKVLDFFKIEMMKQCDINVKLLYGGNVNSNNAEALNDINSLDGYLIGRASSVFDTFEKLVSTINNS